MTIFAIAEQRDGTPRKIAAEVCSEELRHDQIGSNVPVLVTPPIPFLDALFQRSEMLRIRHR